MSVHGALIDPQGQLLSEIADRRMGRADVARTYRLAMEAVRCDGVTVCWETVNRAIIERWSESTLHWIKLRAWSGRRPDGGSDLIVTGVDDADPPGAFLPSPMRIARRAAAIRRCWSWAEERARWRLARGLPPWGGLEVRTGRLARGGRRQREG